jgi:hypothetical protein
MRLGSLIPMIAMSALAMSGCSSSVARPNWLNPGPVAYQQNQALRYDPYPDDSLGPAVVGGRPREYDRPRPPAPLIVKPATGVNGGVAPPAVYAPPGVAPAPGPYSPAPLTSVPAYPQTPYSTPVYAPAPNAAPVAPGPVSP